MKRQQRKRHLSSFQIIILGFAAVVLLGALLLMLPIATKSRVVTPFNEAIFTSTSAVCVTGLVVQDTATYWSAFGQGVILVLIQIGGLGVITVAAAFALLSGRKISLMQRSTMQEAISANKVGGIVRLTSFVLITTFLIESVGALAMLPTFCRDFGVKGIWMAVFHSISAFCNAGFDLMGTADMPFQSMTSYGADPLINIVLMLLIIIGGIGFLTWEDVVTNKHHIKRYRMQSKVILTTTAALIVLPAVFFFCNEFTGLSTGERIFNALFQSVTTRTAGFNTADFGLFGGPSFAIVIVLMLIGGSPGSTAGGMKTTTFAVLLANAASVIRRKEDTQFYGRRIDNNVVRNASTLFVMYFTLFFTGTMVISMVEALPMKECLFETASAIGTVGLSLGVTPQLGIVSQCVLMLLMFFGRVGGLTVIYAAISGVNKNVSKMPLDKLTVG